MNRRGKKRRRGRRDEILDNRAPGAQWDGAMARAQRKHRAAQKRLARHSRRSRRGKAHARGARDRFDRIRSLAGPGRSSRRNPPISERDLRILKRIIATHHVDNERHHKKGARGKKRNPYYTSPARYAKMSTKARARYRQALRAARMRR